jgi:hypothetical protein
MPATELTEIEALEVSRADGVLNPANGFPILLMKAVDPNPDDPDDDDAAKAVNAQGGIDEGPDIAGANRVIVELFKLIQSEASEGAAGAFHEICDVAMLVEAVHAMCCFLDMELWAMRTMVSPSLRNWQSL